MRCRAIDTMKICLYKVGVVGLNIKRLGMVFLLTIQPVIIMDQMQRCITHIRHLSGLLRVQLAATNPTTICSHTALCTAGGALRDALLITR
nr:MAG TPA: hypothetical protein [Caudoviricetes sp.]